MASILAAQHDSIDSNLTPQRLHLGVSDFDQADKLSNHARALCNTGSELLVLICDISRGSGAGWQLPTHQRCLNLQID